MDENLRTSTAESSPADSSRWIGRVVIAVIVAEAIWSLIVSLTNNLALPAMARIVEADAQSPLYLGKGDFNVPALFASVLELCFAGIVAVSLSAWLQRKPKLARTKSVRLTPPVPQTRAPAASAPTTAAPTQTAGAMPVQTKTSVTPQPVTQSSATPSPTLPSSPSAPPSTSKATTKPKPPKKVFYNIVGEPLTSEDDESEN